MEKIIINIKIEKNRGWRGLAKITAYGTEKILHEMIFSFSPAVWDDLMNGTIVLQDNDNYYVLTINNTDKLPQGHQRSVLIKNFKANVLNMNKYTKEQFKEKELSLDDDLAIKHFIKNKNNHTTSDWNCIRNKSYSRNIRKKVNNNANF